MSGGIEGCPFCGGEASLTIPSELVVADCADIYVACDECESEGQHIVVEMRDRGDDLWPDERREAIAAWNTRTAPPARTYADEDVARIIDPHAFKQWQSTYDYSIRSGDTEAEAKDMADWAHGKERENTLAKAAAIRLLSQGEKA